MMTSFCVTGALLGIYACAPEDENPAAPSRNRGGSTTADGATATEDPGSLPTALNCDRWGGPTGVTELANAILDGAKNDCRISPAINAAMNEHKSHLNECFSAFMQSAFRCPGATFTLGKTEDSKGDECRTQAPGVELSERDYTALNEVMKDVVEGRNFTADEVRDMAIVLQNAKLQLVVNDEVPRDKYTRCAANCTSGGEACVRPQPEGGNPPPPVPPPPPDSGTPDSGEPDAN